MDKGKSKRTLIQIMWLFIMAYGLINVWRICDKMTVILTGELVEVVALENASTTFARGDNEYSAPVILDGKVQTIFEGVSYTTKKGDVIRLYRYENSLVAENFCWYKDGHLLTNVVLVGILTVYSMQSRIEEKKERLNRS